MDDDTLIQSEKNQYSEKALDLPPDPTLSTGMLAQAPTSTPPVTGQSKNVFTGPADPYFPSSACPPAETEAFMYATRHALECVLGKASLDRLEALLQQEKKTTVDYIEYLEDAVKLNTGLGSMAQNELAQKELALWKAKAEGHTENTRTEMRLLRAWNVRIKEEKDRLEEMVKEMRRENELLRVKTGRSNGRNGNENDEIKRLRMRNAQLEEEKDAMNVNMQMMLGDCAALKAEIERLKNNSTSERGHQDTDIEMREEHGNFTRGGASAASSSDTTNKNYQRNLKRRARDKARHERVLLKENMQLSAKLSQLESQYSTAHTEALEVRDNVMRKLQAKVEELEREMRSRDERAERLRHTPASTSARTYASASSSPPTSTSAPKSKAKKKRVKKEKKRKERQGE